MQVQSIQTSNNQQRPHFQAQFVRNKHFANFYDWTTKDACFLNKMKNFTTKNPEHVLEIRGDFEIKMPGFDDYPELFSVDESGYVVTILNQYTGKEKNFAVKDGVLDNLLSHLLDLLDGDKEFFANDEYAQTYRKFIRPE